MNSLRFSFWVFSWRRLAAVLWLCCVPMEGAVAAEQATGRFYPLEAARMRALPAQNPLRFYPTPNRSTVTASQKPAMKNQPDMPLPSRSQARQLLDVFSVEAHQ